MKEKILNVGCGNDRYGTHFVDLYPTRDEVVKCNVDEQKIPFPDNYFDEVFSKNIFEHLKNPFFVLKEMKRVLKKGGELVLITDNAGYIFHHINLSKLGGASSTAHQGNGYQKLGELDRHFVLFTKMHMRNFMQELGMKIIKLEYEFYRSHTMKNDFLFGVCTLLRNTDLFQDIAYPHIKLIVEK